MIVVGCSGQLANLQGTVVEPARIAPNFELTNQHGNLISLDSFGGSVVALTFLYTTCTDICPTITDNLRQTYRLIGEDASSIRIIAVSVDPERDSIDAAYEYSKAWGMLTSWDYLVGDESLLKPVWKSYHVSQVTDKNHGEKNRRLDKLDTTGRNKLEQDIVKEYAVFHSGPVYLIDRSGWIRSVFTLPFDPEDLASDLRTLIDEEL